MHLRLTAAIAAIGLAAGLACGKGPTTPQVSSTSSVPGGNTGGSSTTSSSTSSTTTVTSTSTSSITTSSTTTTINNNTQNAQRYIGTYSPSPGTNLPLDLSVYFNLPKSAIQRFGVIRPTAIFDVSGGYNTGANSFAGEIRGQMDGTIGNGTFTGVITADLGFCTASRNYTGPLNSQAFNFSPGAQINTCGSATPLTTGMNATASTLPPTVSSTSTSVVPQSTLVFTFTPNPVPTSGFTTRCSGGTTAQKTWDFTLRIQNTSDVPFAIDFWAVSIEGQPIQDRTLSEFVSIFGTDTIAANSQVTGSLCVWLTTSSGSVRYFFNGKNGNGSRGTPILQLLQ